MRNRISAGLQVKVTSVIAVASLAVIVLIIYLCISYQRKYLIEQFQASTNCLIDAVCSAIIYPMSLGDQQTVKQQMNEFNKSHQQFEIYIFGLDKQVAYTSKMEASLTGLSQITSSPPLFQAIDDMVSNGKIPTRVFDEQVGGSNFMTILRPILNEERCQHCHDSDNPLRGGIMVRQRSDALLEDLSSLRNTVILIGVGGCGAIILLLYFLISGLAVRPLTRAIKGLESVSEDLTGRSRELSSIGQRLADGATEQAAAIEQTSTSIEQMTATTMQNSENAGQASHLAAEAQQVIEKANQSIEDLTGSMREISEASGEAQKIIRTIEEIAFQTNLLALNAAIEAARANEAGAGFAIVAEEVRRLAIRATEAAKNTSDIIEDTAKKVETGSSLVEKANGEFRQVAAIVVKSAELVREIAAASHDQAQGIEQINSAVADLDQVAQQNTVNAEESAVVSEEMSAQAEQVWGVVRDLADLVAGKGAAESAMGPAGTASRQSALPIPKPSAG